MLPILIHGITLGEGSTRIDPVGEIYTISPTGSCSPFSGIKLATIHAIANTGATLTLGQKRSKEITALAVDPRRRQTLQLVLEQVLVSMTRSFWFSQPPHRAVPR